MSNDRFFVVNLYKNVEFQKEALTFGSIWSIMYQYNYTNIMGEVFLFEILASPKEPKIQNKREGCYV